MDQRWIPLPVPPLLAASAPWLITPTTVDAVRSELGSAGGRVGQLVLSSVGTTIHLVEQLRDTLTFPDWCGSSWDSVDDAFEEIRALSTFPCFAIVEGLQELFSRNPHLALELIVRLSELESSFAAAGDQFAVIYEVR